jgi:glycosyltransferase involved in cell wall biosynthesis
LAALAAQTLPRQTYELIFVDNGSTDRSIEILNAVPGLIVLAEPIRDPYLARNCGIRYANGDYLVFLDADCLPEPNWLSEIHLAVTASSASLFLGYLALPQGSVFLRVAEDYYDAKIRYLIARQMTECYFGHAGNMVISASLFRQIGIFLPMPIVGDTEIIHRAVAKFPGSALHYIASARVTHAEVTSFVHCLRKTYETGIYSQTLIGSGGFSTVPTRDRLGIFRLCASLGSYSLTKTAIAWIALASGGAAFLLGRLVAAQRKRPGSSAAV